MMLKSHNDICTKAKSYFENLYCDGNNKIDEIINHILFHLSSDDNSFLLAPFSIEEFKISLFQMYSNKSPSPNGLNLAFF